MRRERRGPPNRFHALGGAIAGGWLLLSCHGASPPAPVSAALAPPAAAPAPSAAVADAPPNLAALTPARVAECTGWKLPLVARSGSNFKPDPADLPPDAGPLPEMAVGFAPKRAPRLELMSMLVYRGKSAFGDGFPSMASRLPPNDPTYAQIHAAEEPPAVALPDGRAIHPHARDFFLGGAVLWATLSSPHGTFEATFVVQLLMHDEGIERDEQEAIGEVDPAKAIACLESTIW